MKRLTIVIGICCLLEITSLHAQGVELEADGSFVTPRARETLVNQLAEEFKRRSKASAPQREQIVAHIRRTPFQSADAVQRTMVQYEAMLTVSQNSNPGIAPPPPSPHITALHAALNTTYKSYIDRFATIRVVVVPSPPRDYKVAINGDECPATERSVYRVMPGEASVTVQRTGKPLCQWSGTVASGAERVVDCQL